jgi:hypothetical protein
MKKAAWLNNTGALDKTADFFPDAGHGQPELLKGTGQNRRKRRNALRKQNAGQRILSSTNRLGMQGQNMWRWDSVPIE